MKLITLADYQYMMKLAGIRPDSFCIINNPHEATVSIIILKQRLRAFLKRNFIYAMIRNHKPVSVLAVVSIKL